jgi:hypothetical protein
MERASGTFWERQLASNWVIILPLAYVLGTLRFNSHLVGLGLSAFAMIVLGLIDYFTYTRFDLRSIRCDALVWIGDISIQPEQVITLRPIYLHAPKNHWHFVEIHYETGEGSARALCQSRTKWIWSVRGEDQTIRTIVEHFPSLKEKVLPEYRTSDYKEVRDPALRKPDPPDIEAAKPSPTARYRDPYFRKDTER